MPVSEVTYYTVVCDGCGIDNGEGSEFTAWSDAHGAEETATACGWTHELVRGSNALWFCFDCQMKREARDDS